MRLSDGLLTWPCRVRGGARRFRPYIKQLWKLADALGLPEAEADQLLEDDEQDETRERQSET